MSKINLKKNKLVKAKKKNIKLGKKYKIKPYFF
jgi:hypothetical protein